MKGTKSFRSWLVIISLLVGFYAEIIFAQDIKSEINQAIDEMQIELETEFAKMGLKETIKSFYNARLSLIKYNYPGCTGIRPGFEDSFSIFEKTLEDDRFETLSLEFAKGFAEEIHQSYENNKNNFHQLLMKMKRNHNLLEDTKPNTILRSQLYFTLILLLADISEYSKAKEATYIYPFCDPK